MTAADLKNYFPDLTELQFNQFSVLQKLYEEWNAQINVISRKDIDELYERHVLHSLAIAKLISFKPGSQILDLGTGGGFPGIPLAILFPEVNFFLVDSIGKKIKVVNEVTDALGLKNVRTAHMRAEEITDKFDFVVSRAVADLGLMFHWVRNKISRMNQHTLHNGLICLKGGDLKEELKQFKNKTKVFEISEFFEGEFFETKKIVYLKI
jgi:16S rRNA (guanine527-N7)-methyltransferase